ncbi:tRNA (guanosine(46)-N7)-methyltransferase TrmB, partial [Clostridium botulinum]|nr:tRNA (guanosine(46)-N7)-methyltransferase TrmB [Clostridium botulinum]
DLHNSDFKENIKTEYETKFETMGMKIMFLKARLL